MTTTFLISTTAIERFKSTAFRFTVLLICLLISDGAFAQVTVNTAIVHFKSGQRPVMNVEVGNTSKHTLYVMVQAEAVPDPGIDSRRTVDTDDLLVSPRNFSIEANGQRTVRLLLRKPLGEEEQVYRVSFIPQDRGFGDEVEHKIGEATAVIRVLSGMGILVFADPAVPKADLKWERSGELLRFTNSGNLHVYIGNGQSCKGQRSAGECEPLPSKRLYAGQSFEVSLSSDKTAFYTLRKGASGDFQRIEIPPSNEF